MFFRGIRGDNLTRASKPWNGHVNRFTVLCSGNSKKSRDIVQMARGACYFFFRFLDGELLDQPLIVSAAFA